LTVSYKETTVLTDITLNKLKNCTTETRQKFVLQVFLSTAALYLKYLKDINRMMNHIENELYRSMANKELIKILNLEKSLVYFATSLKTNEIMMERLQKLQTFRSNTEEKNLLEDVLITAALKANDSVMENLFDKIEKNQIFLINTEEENLLEDVIIENKQAIEMVNIYANIISGLMSTFASLISNNLNNVVKVLTSVTIILMIPTLIASIYGMNIKLPLQDSPIAFILIISLALLFSFVGVIVFRKKKML
jgi:magnesium transporter